MRPSKVIRPALVLAAMLMAATPTLAQGTQPHAKPMIAAPAPQAPAGNGLLEVLALVGIFGLLVHAAK